MVARLVVGMVAITVHRRAAGRAEIIVRHPVAGTAVAAARLPAAGMVAMEDIARRHRVAGITTDNADTRRI